MQFDLIHFDFHTILILFHSIHPVAYWFHIHSYRSIFMPLISIHFMQISAGTPSGPPAGTPAETPAGTPDGTPGPSGGQQEQQDTDPVQGLGTQDNSGADSLARHARHEHGTQLPGWVSIKDSLPQPPDNM